MSGIDVPASVSTSRRRSFRDLQILDWMFVAFGWLTLLWLAFNIFERFNEHPFNDEFDIMPFFAGGLVVSFGWWALRLGERVKRTADGLDESAGLKRMGESTIDAFKQVFRRRLKFWSIGLGIFITAFMSVGFLLFVLSQGEVTLIRFFFDALLGIVMVVTGYVIGSLLGRLIGYGSLWSQMEKYGIRISLANPETRAILFKIVEVFPYAVVMTLSLCLFSGIWWIVWELGYNPFHYRDSWRGLTLGNWLMSFILFIAAGRYPVAAFQKRVDELYGGSEARRGLDRQLKEAKEDRSKLVASLDDRITSGEIFELEQFIADISARRLRPVT